MGREKLGKPRRRSKATRIAVRELRQNLRYIEGLQEEVKARQQRDAFRETFGDEAFLETFPDRAEEIGTPTSYPEVSETAATEGTPE